ncbi:uncharacterized protein LOC115951610 [Quercus lobata]|uniref:uncharacterized protein LOC115951610 n=1 Tax=Quercus lobata TaxID=97700 RepID=UPI001248132B|nr:uncharacterized protein LOC115951610 [Quercus lobata]
MQKYLKLANQLVSTFHRAEFVQMRKFVQIPQDQNAEADEIARSALTDHQGKSTDWNMEEQEFSNIEELQTFPLHTQSGFGILRMIISDNGRQFDSHGFRSFCSNLGIKNKYSSPRHPQANRQIEVTNRTLLKIIKSRLMGAKGAWPKELPSVLWAYRTTTRTPIGETPFNLTYDTEAVILVEVGLTSLRREFFDKQGNDDQLKLNLDCLDEVKDQAFQRMTKY